MQTGTHTSEAASPRDRLLDAAEALIYAGGIHATGVDAIVKRAGAARKSFYSYFESKDELVAAALERRDERWMNWFEKGVSERGNTPRTRLLAMFDTLRVWFEQPNFHGCAFLNAAGELDSPDHPARIVARKHKERLLRFVAAEVDGYADERVPPLETKIRMQLARQWLVLIDGAIGVALVSGTAQAAHDARLIAEALL
jgi:AcrR family transcriptional regulator